MKRKNDAMLVDFRDQDNRWIACLTALDTDYTLSIKQACCILKCSRSWLQRYVRPHVHYIYLSNAMIDGKRTMLGVDYVRLARETLGRDEIVESTWLNLAEFEALIRGNLTFTRQVIKVPIELFVAPDKVMAFRGVYLELQKKVDDFYKKGKDADKDEIKAVLSQIDMLRKQSIDQLAIEYYETVPNKYKRTATQAVRCQPSQSFELSDMVAVHDIMGYGDTEEEIYRRLFADGYYRIEMQLPDADGVLGKKIYYLEPSEAEKKQLLRALKIPDSVEWVPMGFGVFADFVKTRGLEMVGEN